MNFKGFFSLLALVDADYRFILVDVWLSGSSSDAQIFKCSKLRKKIKDGTLGPLEPLVEVGPDLYYFLLGDDALALMPCLVKPYSRRQLMITSEERIANYRIFRGRSGVENAFGILASRFRVILDTMEKRPMVVRDIILTCVSQHAEDTPRLNRHGSHSK